MSAQLPRFLTLACPACEPGKSRIDPLTLYPISPDITVPSRLWQGRCVPESPTHRPHVDPRNTSRRCPSCGWVAKENRSAERFACTECGYRADADSNAAVNVLAKAVGNWQERMVPVSSN